MSRLREGILAPRGGGDVKKAVAAPPWQVGQDRKGISLSRLFKLFPDDDKARLWLEKQIWPDGPRTGSYH